MVDNNLLCVVNDFFAFFGISRNICDRHRKFEFNVEFDRS